MVQLQKDLKAIEAAGVQVVGVSYDSTKALSAFAGKAKISFPLLSDPDSKVITAYGLLNKDYKAGRLKGIPHPATIVIDQKGVIRARLAVDGYAKRHSTGELIKAAKAIK